MLYLTLFKLHKKGLHRFGYVQEKQAISFEIRNIKFDYEIYRNSNRGIIKNQNFRRT